MRRIQCAEIWGGIGDRDEVLMTNGVAATLYSQAAQGGKGGDIYYFSVCSSDLLTRIAIADVVGHGEAVSNTSQWMYHALAELMNCLEGERILEHLNRLVDEYVASAFTTAAVLGFYKANSHLYVAYAGHPPALIYRSAAKTWDTVELLNGDTPANLPLGADVEAAYDQDEHVIWPGDRLFLYTDGVLEATDAHGRQFGLERLLFLLRGLGAASIAEIRTAVLDELRQHTGGMLQHDDVTFMAIEIT